MVYLVLRSEYQLPHGRKVIEFPDRNLLEWFQNHWICREQFDGEEATKLDSIDYMDDISDLLRPTVGEEPCGIWDLFLLMLDWEIPQTMDALTEFISSFDGSYGEGEIEMVGSSIQAVTDDDEIDLAWYLFDTEFSDRFPKRVEFLKWMPFEFPEAWVASDWNSSVSVKPLGKVYSDSPSSTYCCFFSALDGITIREITGCYRAPVSLPEFSNWLMRQDDSSIVGQEWPEDLLLLRAFLFQCEPKSLPESIRLFCHYQRMATEWLPRTFSDFQFHSKNSKLLTGQKESCAKELQAMWGSAVIDPEESRLSPGAGKSQFQFSDHLVQVAFFAESKHWIFFDEEWATANRNLAEGILRYGRGFDVLGS